LAWQRNEPAFWQVILGGFISIGGVFLAVSFAFGIETVKATDGSEIVRFNFFFLFYLITGGIIIVLSLLGASVRFLGWPFRPRQT
jgi:hypothetical protein